MTRRQLLLTLAAAACAGVAVILALLARDVGRRERALRSGDVAAAGPSVPASAWAAPTTLPGDPARWLLGVGDDLAFRGAVAAFRAAYSRGAAAADAVLEENARRVQAETALARVVRSGGDPARVSAASNMLGILAFVDAARAGANTTVDRAIFEFQDAIRLDPANEEAKANLELSYQQTSIQYTVRGRERLQRAAHAGASASPPGHGY